MDKRKQASIEKLLAERREELLKQVLNQDDGIDDLTEDQPADPLDMAGNTSSLELMTALGNHERSELTEIDRALEKIEDGTFGRCEDCGQNIAVPRLKAIPTARLCVPCQEKQERSPQAVYDRPRRRVATRDGLTTNEDES